MIKTKTIKVVLKTILSSDQWVHCFIRKIISKILFGLCYVLRPINRDISALLKIYAFVFSFDHYGLLKFINSNMRKFETHIVISSRAFFEIAFSRGELLKICDCLKAITIYFPHLFIPWKLLHYVYYFEKSWLLLSEVNKEYELYRKEKLKSYGFLGRDLIVGDQVTSSIGHSQIFFDFQILNSHYLSDIPKITICDSVRDNMSSFYKELIPDLFLNNISIKPSFSEADDSVNFIQDSFPFLFAKNYFGYSDERGRTKFLASWAASGAKAFNLSFNQKCILANFLREVGLGEEDWFVVLHVREGADDSIRNADIESYFDAIEAVILAGGWVFRIGDVSMTRLRKGGTRVVDLPFDDISKPNYLDLYLLATARFVICTCSGPSDFPFYFNTPRLVTNWPHMSALHGTSNDICIPVSYKYIESNKIVTLREQLISNDYDNEPKIRALKDVVVVKNTSRQIQQATIEMIERTSGGQYERDNFPEPIIDSLFYKYKDDLYFMGSLSQSFLNENPNYID